MGAVAGKGYRRYRGGPVNATPGAVPAPIWVVVTGPMPMICDDHFFRLRAVVVMESSRVLHEAPCRERHRLVRVVDVAVGADGGPPRTLITVT